MQTVVIISENEETFQNNIFSAVILVDLSEYKHPSLHDQPDPVQILTDGPCWATLAWTPFRNEGEIFGSLLPLHAGGNVGWQADATRGFVLLIKHQQHTPSPAAPNWKTTGRSFPSLQLYLADKTEKETWELKVFDPEGVL